ncbi:MAG: hypothetical protein QOE07_353 [Acidimicrobiaceae bacterium]|nr:hypothetical protein [Acidimicrobiaceae bacterium]
MTDARAPAGAGAGAGAATATADDVLRYAFRQGPGRDLVAPLGPPERALTTSFGSLPDAVATDRMCRLVWGTADLLEDTAYPGACSPPLLSMPDRVQHALVMAFGLQRREPSNLFNDHRACASVRSRFPVHTFLHAGEQAWLLDVYRHGLLPVADGCPGWPEQHAVHVALAGRYTHLPSLYGRLRGPLVELELGISLRSLLVALEVFGLAGDLQLPGARAGALMAQLGLEPAAEWTVPLSVAVREPGQVAARWWRPTTTAHATTNHSGPGDDDDPTLTEAVAVNRTSLDLPALGPPDSDRNTGAIPDGLDSGGRAWSEVLWNRSAGRMPRQVAGVSGRRRPVTAAAVTDSVAWLAVPPPTPRLEAIWRHISIAACLQDAQGYATGWYRLDLERRDLDLVRADAALPARLEACYGQGLSVDAGCAVRHANMVWLLSADVAALVEVFGPGGWTLAQYACGWMAHGLCLAAAAHGLYARPSRAFDEFLLHPVVAMETGEMVLLSVVSGAGRFIEPMLDLRT